MTSDNENKTIDDSRFCELSPGKLLVWARERANLTQEEVAKELYMTLTKVRSLESDDYRHMGSDTFIRGYLRSYANLVKLDVEELLAAYDRHAQEHGLIEPVVPQKVESANKPLWQFIVLILVVLLVVWLLSIWFFDNRQEPAYNPSVVVIPPAEVVMDSQVAIATSSAGVVENQPSASAAVDAMNAGALTQTDKDVAGGDTATQISSMSAMSQSSSSIAPSSTPANQILNSQRDLIRFSFTQECWLEVSDAVGDVLIADLQRAGGSLQLQGKAPFDVKLGNAPGAKIELNGNEVAIVPAIGTNVLSLKVGESTRE
ncbi:RodZ domain-containing protein [Cellvibrio sp. NN19]|uniref:RodZ domain-containing protein n=1 Tax=Cellvibrio chitinivorans TaxID=3102792 RepID=UPI002B412783|nr:RodZ domain-containing protein [Cellvibrio sp. NN19]